MKLKEKVEFLINELETIYPKLDIPLNHKDPYTLLIAVLLSAQSTDKKVNEITPLLFKKADNPYDMIKLSVDQIRDIIKPVGLSPAKSKGIWGLSKILIEKHKIIIKGHNKINPINEKIISNSLFIDLIERLILRKNILQQ